MSETTYLVRDSPTDALAEATVVRSSERADRLSRAGLWVTARTGGGADA